MTQVKEHLLNNNETMDLYTTAITRAHVTNHPEVIQVREEYVNLIKQAETEDANYESSFDSLRKLTDNYTIPADACPTLTAVYEHLQQADQLEDA
ncbi:iron-sulfur cluster repair di-iron protein, ric [Aerococcaceae bacterium DSM 111021]|nr:iron-sulfur cluster repair di-iron protein, ric [Aerococcaceae bacterium DSM 111021]